ncbi:MAG: hypothetical protein EUB_03459 [Eubacterium sp.]
MLQLTIKLINSSISQDIMVNPDQKIIDTLKILKENNAVSLNENLNKILIKSQRKKRYINSRLSYRQAGIFNGDLLQII